MRKMDRRILLIPALAAAASLAYAADDPGHERHELMEGVRDATKVVGAMLRGDAEYDADAAMESLRVYEDAGARLGDLFPEGSEGGEAAPAVWTDRDGFDAEIVKWRGATAAAIAANPQTLDEARPTIGKVLQSCKGCHDSYRIEKE